MKYQKISSLFFSLILSTFLLTSTTYADWKRAEILGGIGREFPGPHYLLHNKDELNLNAGQVEQLKKLRSSSKKAKTRKYADIEILRIELKEILDKESVDKKAVEDKIETIGSLYTQLAKDRVINRLAARELLTDKQFQTWETIIEERVSHGWLDKKHRRKD
jgi:Spy/CpxP family protein refolding chaperone